MQRWPRSSSKSATPGRDDLADSALATWCGWQGKRGRQMQQVVANNRRRLWSVLIDFSNKHRAGTNKRLK